MRTEEVASNTGVGTDDGGSEPVKPNCIVFAVDVVVDAPPPVRMTSGSTEVLAQVTSVVAKQLELMLKLTQILKIVARVGEGSIPLT